MQHQQVLELIELVVRPLREKIDLLEKQNEKIKAQLFSIPISNTQKRLRSVSKERKVLYKRQEPKEVKQIKQKKTPSIKKKDDKPIWGAGKQPIKNDHNSIKSPPPFDKARVAYKSPRATVGIKTVSSQKKSQQSSEGLKEVHVEKKIVGGKKVDQQQLRQEALQKSQLKQQQKKSTTEQQHQTNNEQQQTNNEQQLNNFNNAEEYDHHQYNKSQKSDNEYNKSQSELNY